MASPDPAPKLKKPAGLPTPDPAPARSAGQLAYARKQNVYRDLARQKAGKGTARTAASLRRYAAYLPKPDARRGK